ncbi:hypothetical protein [Borreliella spielmanii]|uniref:Uncharacterized protein n=1 Tax=Borreliella spielmanii A14S TaxID=498742 RepID=C0RBN5_9SPIR|nr:hypothetical protein [Borreliella spielmanii]ACN53170.1 hypothetical protein BSPA14S_N0008 [Borreliella spielmanii A14S]
MFLILILIFSVSLFLNFGLVRNYLFNFVNPQNRRKIGENFYFYLLQNIINTFIYSICFIINFDDIKNSWVLNFDFLDVGLSFFLLYLSIINILGYYFLLYFKVLRNSAVEFFGKSLHCDIICLVFSLFEIIFSLGFFLPFLKQYNFCNYIILLIGALVYSFLCLNSRIFILKISFWSVILNGVLYLLVFFYLALNFIYIDNIFPSLISFIFISCWNVIYKRTTQKI